MTVYAPGTTSVLRAISQGLNNPDSLAFDRSGNLYVANRGGNSGSGGDTVTVYAPGSTSVLRTISQGLNGPVALAFDRTGNLYVANYSNVTVYAPGSTSVLRTISHTWMRRGRWRLTAPETFM